MRRSSRGQSMVEYALGIGCVAAVCMAAMSMVGHISGDIFNSVQSNINYAGGPGPHGVADPGKLVNEDRTPWQIQ
jgi:Flp pilus assembly pilin Flp